MNFFVSLQQVNYKMRMNIRRMAQGDRKHHKRSKRLNKVRTKQKTRGVLYVNHDLFTHNKQDGSKQNHVSFPEFQQNGSAKQFANGTNTTNSIDHLSLSKKIKRKRYHSHKKYRRLEIGNKNCIAKSCNLRKMPVDLNLLTHSKIIFSLRRMNESFCYF